MSGGVAIQSALRAKIYIHVCMSVIFAIKDIFFHKLRHLASLPPWCVCVWWWRSDTLFSAHPDLDRRLCARFLWALKEKYLINNDLQEESITEEGEEDTEGYILAMEATRRWQRSWGSRREAERRWWPAASSRPDAASHPTRCLILLQEVL